jgi:hypothetical protein
MRATTLITLTALTTVFGACAAERDDSGQIQTAGTIDAFAMQVGDCVDDWALGGTEVAGVPGIPCADPHDNEVFALFDLADGPWPGDEQVELAAQQGCYDRFQGAIGATYEDSILDYLPIYPSEDSWRRMKDREVICIAYHMEYEKLTGTVLNSGL